jgi:hypothetical protein
MCTLCGRIALVRGFNPRDRRLGLVLLLSLPVLVCARGGARNGSTTLLEGLEGTLMAISYVGGPLTVPGGVTTGVRTAVL